MGIGAGCLGDVLAIISVILLVLGLGVQGAVSPEVVGVFLLVLIAFRAIGRALGEGIGRAVRYAFTIGLPLASLFMFAVAYSQGNLKDLVGILSALGALVLTWLGIYIIFRGLSSR